MVPLTPDFADNGDGSLTAAGIFGAAAIEPATGMDMALLESHMGMGHIWLKVSTPEGAVYGAFEEANAGSQAGSSSDDMDMGEHGGHSMGGMNASSGSSGEEDDVLPAVSAMEGSKEGGDHSHHRRLLRAS